MRLEYGYCLVKALQTLKMIKKFTILAGMVAVLVSLAPSVKAVPITGSVTLLGGGENILTPVGSRLGTATGVAATTGIVLGGDGSFLGTAGSSVNFSSFLFSSISTPVNPLWSFAAGGLTYSFDLTAMTVKMSGGAIYITGTGMLSIAGSDFDPTAGTWTYLGADLGAGRSADTAGLFGFLSSNTATTNPTSNLSLVVPDGGMTIILLGAALSAIYFFRKQTLA
jgi:hypothetical protein